MNEGKAVVDCKGKVRHAFISREFKRLLIPYIRTREINSGPVFVTRNHNPIHRSNVWREMKALCEAVGVSPDKISNPKVDNFYEALVVYGIPPGQT